MASGELNYTINLDNKQFVRASQSVRDAFGNMASRSVEAGRSMQESMSGSAKVTANLGGAAVKMGAAFAVASKVLDLTIKAAAKLGGAVKGFIDDGMKAAGAYEKMAVSMKMFAGSAELGAEAARQVAAFAETPPFGIEETQAAARLLMVTGTEVKNLTGELTVLGNIAAAGGRQISDMAKRMNEWTERGGVDMGGLTEMMQSGIPIIQTLSKVMGLPTIAVQRLAKEGRISVENMKAAFNELGGAGGKFGNAMDELANTTPGKIEGIKGAWETLQRKIMEPINDAIKPLLDFVMERIKILTEVVATGSELIKKLWAGDQLGSFFKEVLIGAFKTAGNYGLAAMKTLGQSIYAILETVVLNTISLFNGQFNQAIKGIGGMLWGTLQWAVGKAAAWLIDGLTKAGTVIAGILAWAVDQARYGLEVLVEKAKSLIPTMSGNPDKVRKAISFNESMQASDDAFKGSFLGEFSKDLSKSSDDALTEGLKGWTNGLDKAWETLRNNLKESFGKIGFKVEDILGSEENWKKAGNIANSVAPGEWKRFMDGIKRLVSRNGKPGKDGTDQEQKLAGANTAIKQTADSMKKAADAAEKLARMMDDAATLAAQANGRYSKAASMRYTQELKDKTKTYMEAGFSDKEAARMAAKDMKNTAKFEMDMEDPAKRARAERAEKRERRRWGTGNVETLAKRAAEFAPGLGGASTDLTALSAQPGNMGIKPADKKDSSGGLVETVKAILTEIQGMKKSIDQFAVV